MILTDLELTDKLFREIMILSGTDYNIHSKTTLFETIRWLYEYRKYLIEANKSSTSNDKKPLEFYVWLVKNTKYIDDYMRLLKIYKMFLLENTDQPNDNMYKNHIKPEKVIDMEKLKQIMREEGFIFL